MESNSERHKKTSLQFLVSTATAAQTTAVFELLHGVSRFVPYVPGNGTYGNYPQVDINCSGGQESNAMEENTSLM